MIKKTDSNHKEIMQCFRQLGFSVCDLSAVGKGIPDILVAKHNLNFLVEIKTDKGKLNDKQIGFKQKWLSDIFVVRNVADVVKLNNLIAKNP